MNQQPAGKLINFRASPRLIGALEERARASGVSVSELLRAIVRENVPH